MEPCRDPDLKFHARADLIHDHGAALFDKTSVGPALEPLFEGLTVPTAYNEDKVVEYFLSKAKGEALERAKNSVEFYTRPGTDAFQKEGERFMLVPGLDNKEIGFLFDAGSHLIDDVPNSRNLITFGSLIDPGGKPLKAHYKPMYKPFEEEVIIDACMLGLNPKVIDQISVKKFKGTSVICGFRYNGTWYDGAAGVGDLGASTDVTREKGKKLAGFFQSNEVIASQHRKAPSDVPYYIGKFLGDALQVLSIRPTLYRSGAEVTNTTIPNEVRPLGWTGDTATVNYPVLNTNDRLNHIRAFYMGVASVLCVPKKPTDKVYTFKYIPAAPPTDTLSKEYEHITDPGLRRVIKYVVQLKEHVRTVCWTFDKLLGSIEETYPGGTFDTKYSFYGVNEHIKAETQETAKQYMEAVKESVEVIFLYVLHYVLAAARYAELELMKLDVSRIDELTTELQDLSNRISGDLLTLIPSATTIGKVSGGKFVLRTSPLTITIAKTTLPGSTLVLQPEGTGVLTAGGDVLREFVLSGKVAEGIVISASEIRALLNLDVYPALLAPGMRTEKGGLIRLPKIAKNYQVTSREGAGLMGGYRVNFTNDFSAIENKRPVVPNARGYILPPPPQAASARFVYAPPAYAIGDIEGRKFSPPMETLDITSVVNEFRPKLEGYNPQLRRDADGVVYSNYFEEWQGYVGGDFLRAVVLIAGASVSAGAELFDAGLGPSLLGYAEDEIFGATGSYDMLEEIKAKWRKGANRATHLYNAFSCKVNADFEDFVGGDYGDKYRAYEKRFRALAGDSVLQLQLERSAKVDAASALLALSPSPATTPPDAEEQASKWRRDVGAKHATGVVQISRNVYGLSPQPATTEGETVFVREGTRKRGRGIPGGSRTRRNPFGGFRIRNPFAGFRLRTPDDESA